MIRILLSLLIMFLPNKIKNFSYRFFFNYQLHESVCIGFSLILADQLIMENNSKIGHFNVIKGAAEVSLGESATIGNLNWISGFPVNTQSLHFSDQANRSPKLLIGNHAAISNRHLIDCTDTVTIGNYTTLAGFRSQILTHSISIVDSRQRSGPVNIGNFSFIGTASIILPNTNLPSFSLLGAGSVLNKKYIDEFYLYAGNPARPLKKLEQNAAYFSRKIGFVI